MGSPCPWVLRGQSQSDTGPLNAPFSVVEICSVAGLGDKSAIAIHANLICPKNKLNRFAGARATHQHTGWSLTTRCLAFDGLGGIAPMLRLADQKILIRSQAFR